MTPHGIGGDFTSWTSNNGGHSHTGRTEGTTLSVSQIPSHTHSMYYRRGGEQGGGATDAAGFLSLSADFDFGYYTNTSAVQPAGGSSAHSHAIYSDGTHGHSVYSVPPYYALCYIMKL